MYGNCSICGERYGTTDGINYYPSCNHIVIINELNQLTDEERLGIFNEYCKYCGCENLKCQCINNKGRNKMKASEPVFSATLESKSLTKRDYMAIEAMKSYILQNNNYKEEDIAFVAYKMADEMIKESNK